MDYFQGVVTEYLRADRAMFVDTECCIQLNPDFNPDRSGPHWYCDVVAVNFRTEEVFLCEVTYAKGLEALVRRLVGWAENWQSLRIALVRDCSLPAAWPVRPWVFVPSKLRPLLSKKVRPLGAESGEGMPSPVVTDLEAVLPWKYPSWNRRAEQASS